MKNINDFWTIHSKVYLDKNTDYIQQLTQNPFCLTGRRHNSIAVVGGALGDEGKGRLTDELTANFLKEFGQVVQYRDNGGANAGHTVKVGSLSIALHQLTSGIIHKNCLVVLGKEMVLHPEDLVAEIDSVLQTCEQKSLPAELLIDELAFLCLDTHRAFEGALKAYSAGSTGATGRGIAPAYCDILYRHPLQMRDLYAHNWQEKVAAHYNLYSALLSGFSFKLAQMRVVRLNSEGVQVGNLQNFIARLDKARQVLKPYVKNARKALIKCWDNINIPFVFEKGQGLGLDKRWGVYPDVTASDCSFGGIFTSSEGVINPDQIAVRAAAIKATYTSSVGQRKLPTQMDEQLAHKIREDANEYGATTKRPRDIAHIDLPMLSYLFANNKVEYLLVTHLDICYSDQPIKVCVGYKKDGDIVGYLPDQQYLNTVEPIYIELPSWNGQDAQNARQPNDLPLAAQQYLSFISESLGVKLLIAATGPKREQAIYWY